MNVHRKLQKVLTWRTCSIFKRTEIRQQRRSGGWSQHFQRVVFLQMCSHFTHSTSQHDKKRAGDWMHTEKSLAPSNIDWSASVWSGWKDLRLPAGWPISASRRVSLLSTFCRCQSSAGCPLCVSVVHYDKKWVEVKLTLCIYKACYQDAREKRTYSVLGAARHDVFESDFWHVVVAPEQVTD